MIVAVVLSAGESSRMGRPKALLPIDGQTFIERIVAALKQTTVGKVLDEILKQAELSYRHKDGVIFVTPSDRPGL